MSLGRAVALGALAACAPLGGLSGGEPGDGDASARDAPAGAADAGVVEGSTEGCGAGFVTCPPRATGSCETFTAGDVSNCGACNAVCGASHASRAPSCVDGRCVVECNAGFGECDGDPSTGCEADLSSDARNCGACGRICVTGACANGACSAQVVGPADDRSPIWLDDANAYFLFSGNLVSCAKTGCTTPTILVAGLYKPKIAFDGTTFFEADQAATQIVACAKTGCGKAPAAVVHTTAAYGVAVDATTLYFVDANAADTSEKIEACPKTGCSGSPTVLVSSPGVELKQGFERAGSALVWTSNLGVRACALPGCATVVPISGAASGYPPWFSTDGASTVYFTGDTSLSVFACPLSGCGASPTPFSTAGNGIQQPPIGVDGDTLYVGSSLVGGVARCPKSSCASPTAAGITSISSGVVADDTWLYWVDAGELKRRPK